MSHATLCKLNGIDWQEDHRVAEGCLSDKALYRYLERHPEIDEIVFCYDNDVDGQLPDGTPHNHGQVRAEISAEIFAEFRLYHIYSDAEYQRFQQGFDYLFGTVGGRDELFSNGK